MNEKQAVEQLVQQVREFAHISTRGVEMGVQTPRLAALLVHNYGRGVTDAVATIFNSSAVAAHISKALEEEVKKLGPLWHEHDKERQETGSSTDVVVHR